MDFDIKLEKVSKAVCRRLGINENRWKQYSALIEAELIKKELNSFLNNYVEWGDYIDQRLLNEEAKTDK